MWHHAVVAVVSALITLLTIVLGLVAFVHCATQRSDAFPAIGTLQKPAWLAIIGVSVVFAMLNRYGLGLFNLIAIAASAIYLLDVRPGLRDVTGGRGSW
ncbi:MAG TPA: DUF2516 family protein [Natronosporangium sp.]|nr:DUF2516 family protein [Natronosporangium sp.]